MSEYEEPAAKLLKIEVGPKEGEDEMDEGHEEWLSEGILTDDDYNPAADRNKTDSNVNTSQDDTTPSINDADLMSGQSKDIEDTLDNLQRSNQTELPEELGAFLIRKTDGRIIDSKKEESEIDESAKQSEDDGHDTDELLRMLGEDNNSSKKDSVKKLEQKRMHESQSSDEDDDEYIFEGAKVARLKIAKNAILKKYPTKAVPEETSDRDTDVSSDEGLTVKRMFGVSRKLNVASKSTAKSSINAMKTVTKKAVSFPKVAAKTPATSTPLQKLMTAKLAKMRPEPEEIIDEEEFLEEEQFDLDEEFESEAEVEGEGDGGAGGGAQRIMRPERMDEEAPSDADSRSDDDSLYDELPSSDSEDLNEWFTLDIRSERAGDYITAIRHSGPPTARRGETEGATRLSTLKQSVSALNESSAQQAEMLRRATLQLAELDAALKA